MISVIMYRVKKDPDFVVKNYYENTDLGISPYITRF